MFLEIKAHCPSVTSIKGGSVRDKVLEDGSLQVIYSCDKGYKLKGYAVLICKKNGFDYQVPECVPRGN